MGLEDRESGEEFFFCRTTFSLTSIQVLEYSSDDPRIDDAIPHITNMCFLEESWLLVSCCSRPVPRLLVFDTRLPQQDPRSWQILDLPPVPSLGRHLIVTRRENPFAEWPEFLVDPAQRIFALFTTQSLVLLVPAELLIRYAHSVRTGSCIPWDEWGEDVITVHPNPNALALQIFDMKVLVLRRLADPLEVYGVDVYDLGRWGRKDIQIQQVNGGAGGRCRKILPAPKWFIPCHRADKIPQSMSLLGNVA